MRDHVPNPPDSGTGLPPPFDRHPGFQAVYFDRAGNPLLGPPPQGRNAASMPTIHCIVPDPSNLYTHRFGVGNLRDWDTPPQVQNTIESWYELGMEVTIHSRNPRARVAGVSQGKAHFLCGSGISLFIIRELGLLPEEKITCGVVMHRMVVTLAVGFPNPEDLPASYHIVLAEYLMDPPLPGLPLGLTLDELRHWIPPPPEFSRGQQVPGNPGLSYARVVNEISEKEMEEGGGTLFCFTLRGASYFRINGWPQPARM